MPLRYNPFTRTFDIVAPPVKLTLEDLSKPPLGCKKIKNIYVDPTTNKTVVIFKDEPEK